MVRMALDHVSVPVATFLTVTVPQMGCHRLGARVFRLVGMIRKVLVKCNRTSARERQCLSEYQIVAAVNVFQEATSMY